MNQIAPYLFLILLLSIYVLYILFKKYYLPKIYGSIGEYYVARVLRRLNKNDYIVYNNIYLKKDERTSQIDHLVLSIYGIFVIETKNYKGWIFGNEKSKYWTQILFKRKHKIYNPVIQNWTHINFIKNISYEFRNLNFIPIVVFTDRATLRKISSSVPVIKRRKLLKSIKSNKDVCITHGQLAKIDSIIKKSLINGKEIKKEHERSVKKIIKENNNINLNTCPKCGGKLAVKQGKYGSFQGCSNFPICKFTKNIY